MFKNFHSGEQLQKVADSFAAWIYRIRVDGAFVCFLFLVPKKNSDVELYDQQIPLNISKISFISVKGERGNTKEGAAFFLEKPSSFTKRPSLLNPK